MATHEITRIGIVYDGSYFARISDHYARDHARRARIQIKGLHEFIRHKVADCEKADVNVCRIVEAHYFRGRFPADEAERRGSLSGDRRFEDVLIRAGITPHFLLLAMGDGESSPREKGIDVWLALEAYDLANVKGCDVIVLISGDGDHVQLVRKLHSAGARVMVLAWDVVAEAGMRQTRTAQALIDAATYSIEMAPLIDGRGHDALVDGIFMPKMQEAVGHAHEHQPVIHHPRPDDDYFNNTQYGMVINMPPDKDFGFIRPDDGHENIHFHFSVLADDLVPHDNLRVGTHVSYVPSVNPNSGKLTAQQVKYASEEFD